MCLTLHAILVLMVFHSMNCDGMKYGNSTGTTSTKSIALPQETIDIERRKFGIETDRNSAITMAMEESASVNVTFWASCEDSGDVYILLVYTTETYVAQVVHSDTYNLSCSSRITSSAKYYSKNDTHISRHIKLNLKADLLGRTWLMFDVNNSMVSEDLLNATDSAPRVMVIVKRTHRTIDTAFRALVYFFLVISTIGMGCKLRLSIVKGVLKRPIAPGIGFGCQYLFMPLIAFTVAKLVPFDNPAVALGIFACGVCPGGGASNIYSYLLGGDLSLSITMTTISNIGALGMVPLWMFTLGQQFKDDKMSINIPYWNIIQTLASVILPLFVGLFFKYKVPSVARVISKLLKPVTLVTVVVLLTFGIYANLYIFRLFSATTLMAGCMLPYVGYLVGGVIGLICRQPWYRVKTIAIETGVQNTMVAFLMLQMALPPPDGDLAAVAPAASACMTPLPLFVLSIGYTIYLKCTGQDFEEVNQKEPMDKHETETSKNENAALEDDPDVEKNKKLTKKDKKGNDYVKLNFMNIALSAGDPELT